MQELHILAIPASADATDWRSQNFMKMCDFWGLPCSFPLLGKVGDRADWTMNQLFGQALQDLPVHSLVAILDASDTFIGASQGDVIQTYRNISQSGGPIVLSHNAGCAINGCRSVGVRAAKAVSGRIAKPKRASVNDGFHMGPVSVLSKLWASFGNRSATQQLGQLIKAHPEMITIDSNQALTATIPWWEWNAHFETIDLPSSIHAGGSQVTQQVRNRRTGAAPCFYHLPELHARTASKDPDLQVRWTVHFDQLVNIAVPVEASRKRRTSVGWPYEICKFKTAGPCRHARTELCCGFDRDKLGNQCPDGFRQFITPMALDGDAANQAPPSLTWTREHSGVGPL
jgi:hypothetical protein